MPNAINKNFTFHDKIRIVRLFRVYTKTENAEIKSMHVKCLNRAVQVTVIITAIFNLIFISNAPYTLCERNAYLIHMKLSLIIIFFQLYILCENSFRS